MGVRGDIKIQRPGAVMEQQASVVGSCYLQTSCSVRKEALLYLSHFQPKGGLMYLNIFYLNNK